MVLSAATVCAQDFPLLHARRSQGAPFNGACPEIDGKRALVGCVMTATEHIINYWHYPETLCADIPEYTTDAFSLPAVSQGTVINWTDMQEDYLDSPYSDEAAKAVADLSLWIGQAVRAKYGIGATSASSWRVPDVLREVFGYGTVEICSRDAYTAPSWRRLLENELRSGRPLYLSGYYVGGGHAWVVDGVRDSMYHCNWGEDNWRDGWYHQDAFNEFQNPQDFTYMERFGGFASNQLCIIAAPDEVETFAWDSIHTSDYVSVRAVSLLRQPTASDYVLADVTLENTHEDTLYYTLEGLSFPTDVWERGDREEMLQEASYCGVISFVLPPRQTVTQRACFSFSKSGERVFAVTFDEEVFQCPSVVTVLPARYCRLDYSELSVTFPEEGVALIDGSVTNVSQDYTSGAMLTFALVEADSDDYESEQTTLSNRYVFLNLPPGEETRFSKMTDTHSPVCFSGLEPGETYKVWLRVGWPAVVRELTFTVPEEPSGVEHVKPCAEDASDALSDDVVYDLMGRRLAEPKGIYIRGGRLFRSPN